MPVLDRRMDEYTTTPLHKNKSTIGCQTQGIETS